MRFDFNSGASATAAGYVGLGGDNVYNAARGYGWIAPANVFDNNGSDLLLSDGHWSQDDTFLVDVPNGTYDVTLTLGDDYATRPQLYVYAEGALVTSSLVTPQGQRTVYSVPSVAVSDGQLALRIASPVYPFTLNALEVRLSTAVGTIALGRRGVGPGGREHGDGVHGERGAGQRAGDADGHGRDAGDGGRGTAGGRQSAVRGRAGAGRRFGRVHVWSAQSGGRRVGDADGGGGDGRGARDADAWP